MLQSLASTCHCPYRQRASSKVPPPRSRRQAVVFNFKFPQTGRSKSPQRSSPKPADVPEASDTNGFKSSVEVMLNRAASSLNRGPCTCLTCRGGGTVECPHCKGTGRLGAAAVERASLLRSAVRRFRTAVGLTPHDVPYASSQWVQTNRCPRCRGSGRLLCTPCGGTGLRFPHLAHDHWRQCAGQPGAEGIGPDSEDACPME